VVENVTGAGGNLAVERAAKAAPDGHTLLMGGNSALVISPSLFARLPYDPVKDFAYITQVFTVANILVVRNDVPAKTIQELVALAKAQPNYLIAGHAGIGTSQHLAGELFKVMAGVDIIHVPYKGAGAAYGDVISGTVHMMFANMPSMLPQVRGGKLKGLGVTSAERSRAAPEIPAIGETLPGYVATSWYGLGAPAGTPEPIVARLEAAVADALANPEIQKRWRDDLGLAAFVAADRKAWEPAVKASGVKLD